MELLEDSYDWGLILNATYKYCLGKEEDFRNFTEADSDAERVTWCSRLPIWSDDDVCRYIRTFVKQSHKDRCAKSDEQSTSWRQKGNAWFKKELYIKALSCYTLSVLSAPNYPRGLDDGTEIISNSAELALAFGNRSAALCHLGHYELAVQECGRAVRCGYPSTSLYKLLHRRGQCLLHMGQCSQAAEVLRQALLALDEAINIDGKRKGSLKTDMNQLIHSCLQSSSKGVPNVANNLTMLDAIADLSDRLASASQSLGLRCSKDSGRYLVADSPVSAGELIIKEIPYAVILLPENHTTHCHQCCKRTLNPIPCPECIDVQYCSVQCLQTAQDSHHWLECGLWNGIKSIGTQAWLGLRLLLHAKSWCIVQRVKREIVSQGTSSMECGQHLQTAPQTSEKTVMRKETASNHEVEAQKVEGTSQHGCGREHPKVDVQSSEGFLPHGCGRDGSYRDDYLAVYHLMPHTENHPPQEVFNMAMTALLLSKCIQEKLQNSSRWRHPVQDDTYNVALSNVATATDCKTRNPDQKNKTTLDKSHNQDTASSHNKQCFNSADPEESACQLETKSEPCSSLHNNCSLLVAKETAAVLLRHMQQLKCNAHAVTAVQTFEDAHPVVNSEQSLDTNNSRLKNIDGNIPSGASGHGLNSVAPVVDTTKQVRLATAIYPTASLLNHACEPNVIASFDGAVLTMRATRDIQAGDEILHCYGPHAKHVSREERQKALQEQYFFTCACHACKLTPADETETCDWSSAFGCSKCGRPLAQREVKKKVGVCLNQKCRNTQSLRELSKEKERAANLFKLSQHFMECKHIEESLGILHQCYNVQREILYKHHKALAETQDCLAKCHSFMGDFKTAGKYLRLSVATVEKQYGSESIELANELHKLAQVLFNGGEVQDTLVILDGAMRLMMLHYGPNHRDVQELKQMRTCLLSV